jgi:hypothetical protein
MNSWKRLLPFLALNILLSAGTTLLVLWVWDRAESSDLHETTPVNVVITQATTLNTPEPLPPLGEPVIQIENIFGAGDLKTETVRLVRLGTDPIWLTGWKLTDQNGNAFTFPELGLLQEGAFVEVYTRAGHNTPFELYWNQNDAVWSSGETATLIDNKGNVRATYTIP